jgi:hypothetical protein
MQCLSTSKIFRLVLVGFAVSSCAFESSKEREELPVNSAFLLTLAETSRTELIEKTKRISVYALVVRRDTRRCVAPRCGGYVVRLLNNPLEQYVSGIDSKALDPTTLQQMASAGDGEIVLRGYFGTPEKTFNTRPFIALEVYRGTPGVVFASGEQFYKATGRDPQVQCLIAPCPNEVATLLNTKKSRYFDGYSVKRSVVSWGDEAWLTERIVGDDAIVSARFTNGDHFPGGYTQILDASDVFIRLPYSDGPCPLMPIRECEEPLVNVFTRSPDRCIVPNGCVKPSVCPEFVPECRTGYTLDSWAVAPDGCPAFTCDPSFLTQPDE